MENACETMHKVDKTGSLIRKFANTIICLPNVGWDKGGRRGGSETPNFLKLVEGSRLPKGIGDHKWSILNPMYMVYLF